MDIKALKAHNREIAKTFGDEKTAAERRIAAALGRLIVGWSRLICRFRTLDLNEICSSIT